MSSSDLMRYLEKIACTSNENRPQMAHYALTADNLLKMALIVSNICFFFFCAYNL